MKSIIALVLTLFLWVPAAFSQSHCLNEFGDSQKQPTALDSAQRLRLIERPHSVRQQSSWMERLKNRGKLIYSGQHKYVPGSDFLASNEYDWFRTPFDSKPTDLLIAFGTNTAWEIAINKKARKVILADWSPNPLLAHAYLIAPLMRISKTPQELILHLSGQQLQQWSHLPIRNLLMIFSSQFELPDSQVKIFLKYLSSRPEIRDDELEFLSSYFWSRSLSAGPWNSPFQGIRSPSFANLVGFLHGRYSSIGEANEPLSALHNPSHFTELRALFNENRIEYAWTEVADPKFYELVHSQNPKARNMTLSLTNIFDMPYAGHSFQSFQRYLQQMIQTGGISIQKPMTVFRTTNGTMPHGFYRYDIKSKDDIPKIDEIDSIAVQEPNRAAGF